MSTDVTTVEACCAYFLRRIPQWAQAQWRRQHQAIDLDIYLDAGYDALTRKLATYDPTRGATFVTYAYTNIRGAIQNARRQWSAWHQGRPAKTHGRVSAEVLRRRQPTPEDLCLGMAVRGLARLPAVRQRWCVAAYQGYTMREHAAQEGVVESRISQRVKAWQMAQQGGASWD